MSGKSKTMVAVAAVAAASIGTAFYFKNKSVQLNVTALESEMLKRYPTAVINSIEKSTDEDNVYFVKLTISEQEYTVLVTSKGEVISTSPEIQEGI